MSSGSHSKVKLNVRVPPSKKEEWKDALEDGETLTSLVRRAVDREINNEYVPIEVLDDVGGTQETDFSEVTDQLDTLQALVESLQRQIDLESISEEEAPAGEDISDLAMEIVEVIPRYHDLHDGLLRATVEIDDEVEAYETAIEYAQQNDPEKLPDATVTDIAQKLRKEDDHIVWQALVYLERRTTEPVESVAVGGQRYWIRV